MSPPQSQEDPQSHSQSLRSFHPSQPGGSGPHGWLDGGVELVGKELLSGNLWVIPALASPVAAHVRRKGRARYSHEWHTSEAMAGHLARHKDPNPPSEGCNEEAICLRLCAGAKAPPLTAGLTVRDLLQEIVCIV